MLNTLIEGQTIFRNSDLESLLTTVNMNSAHRAFIGTEVLVVSNEDASLAYGPGQDVQIINLRHYFSNSKRIMAKTAQICDYPRTGGLVYDEMHNCFQLPRHGEGENVFVG